MRAVLLMVAFLGSLALGLASEPAWQLAREPGAGCWPPNCEDGQVPLATPVVSHAGRLFMIGDGAAPDRVYESQDGRHWRGFKHDASWGKRYKSADASYGGALWRVGGWVEENGRVNFLNNVWRSK